jgi:outer membrane protein assembly factor BamE
MQNSPNTFYQKIRTHLVFASLLVIGLFSGCSTSLGSKPITDKVDRPILSRFFNPYRPDVVQGNFVSKDQLDSIRPGMAKEQIRQILGTPLLQDYFHKDRWDYTFMYRVGETQQVDQRTITLFFKGNILEKIIAGQVPSDQEFVNEIDEIKKNHRRIDNKVNLSAQDAARPANSVPIFPNPQSPSGAPAGGIGTKQ